MGPQHHLKKVAHTVTEISSRLVNFNSSGVNILQEHNKL